MTFDKRLEITRWITKDTLCEAGRTNVWTRRKAPTRQNRAESRGAAEYGKAHFLMPYRSVTAEGFTFRVTQQGATIIQPGRLTVEAVDDPRGALSLYGNVFRFPNDPLMGLQAHDEMAWWALTMIWAALAPDVLAAMAA